MLTVETLALVNPEENKFEPSQIFQDGRRELSLFRHCYPRSFMLSESLVIMIIIIILLIMMMMMLMMIIVTDLVTAYPLGGSSSIVVPIE